MRSLIFGVRGQDGSYLADYLLSNGEEVIGAKRRSCSSSDWRLKIAKQNKNFLEVDCDITDFSSVLHLINEYQPDKIFNLAAQSVTEDSILPIRNNFNIEYMSFKKLWDKYCNKRIVEMIDNYIEVVNLPENLPLFAMGYWNGTGHWFKIKQISRHKWNGKVVQMDQKFGSICVTPNHSILDTNNQVCKPDDNPWLLNVRKFNFNLKPLSKIKFGDIIVTKNKIKYLCKFIGAFVAEGSTYHNKCNGSYFVNISEQSKEWLTHIQSCFSKILKLNSNITEHKKNGHKSVYELQYSSKKLYKLMRKICGTKSNTKKLPNWFLRLSKQNSKILFDTLIYGDGCVDNNVYRYTTSSYILACQFSYLLTQNNYDYTVQKEYNDLGEYYHFRTCTTYNFNSDKNSKKIKYLDYDGYVYDISVDEVSNFAVGVGNIVVHNSQVGTSFNQPFYTLNSITVGTTNILESMRILNSNARFYHAATSEMFGSAYDTDSNTGQKYQDENTKFVPRSPYGVAKLAAHQMVCLYRDAYSLWACSGILFNHCSPRRGEYFVSRKITKWIAETVNGYTNEPIKLGNLRSYRDWGHAKDYVVAMDLMLKNNEPKDYIIGTGETYTVYDFWCLACLLSGIDREKIVIEPSLMRPAEVDYLCAKPDLAKKELGWKPQYDFKRLVKDMVNTDINNAKK